jgi:peptidoglycan/LPS O-acetylase OafA/YrhL
LEAIEQPLPKPPDIQPGPEVPTPRRPPRFPAFDGLRAIAAVTVVGVHTAFISGFDGRQPGWGIYAARLEIGVSVFFLISGFLLYRPFVVAHLAGTSLPRVGAFWGRRLLRIVPAYWLVLFVMTTLWHNPPGIGPSGWWSQTVHYLFLQIYFPDQVIKGLSAAWSLCVEMSFYLFVPFYAMVIRRGRARRTPGQAMRREFVGLVCMVAVSYLWRAVVIAHQTPHGGWWAVATVWLPAYLDLFAFGMFLAATSAWFHQHDSEWRIFSNPMFPVAAWICAGACFWAVGHIGIPTFPIYTETSRDLTRQLLYGGFAFFLLLPAVYGPQGKGKGPIRWFLGTWPMASLGVISYGIYLWHEPWIYRILHAGPWKLFSLNFAAFFLAVMALSVVSATLSYFVLEKPVLRYKNSLSWWRRPATVPATPPGDRSDAHPESNGDDVDDAGFGTSSGSLGWPATTGPVPGPAGPVPDELGQPVHAEQEERHPGQGVGGAEAGGPDDVGQVAVDPLRDGHVPDQRRQQAHDGDGHDGPRPGQAELGHQQGTDDDAGQRHDEEPGGQRRGAPEHDAEGPGDLGAVTA